jgi:pimeloyl-ACP methyl ester carboxylesterase
MTQAFNWPAPTMITTNGIGMGVHQTGETNPGPALVFVHGWPELAFSWRHQVAALAQAGYRCFAPDMRGFGATDRPSAITAYDQVTLCADLVGLLDAFAIKDAIFVGHDWGGLVVWEMARRHPTRVAGVISVCTPHRARLPFEPIAGMRARWGDDFYIVYFQQPGPAEALFEADLDKTFRFLQRSGPQTKAATATAPKDAPFLALHLALQAWDGDKAAPTLLSPQERQVYIDAYRISGFVGGLNWYRNFTRNWQASADVPDTVSQPSLMIMAEWDAALPPSACDGMEALIPDLEKHLIPRCGHWAPQEAPEAVNAMMLTWLARRFSVSA